MSRSIHDTIGVARRAWIAAVSRRPGSPGAEYHWRLANEARRNVAVQRTIKQRVARDRGRRELPRVDAGSIPILERATGPTIHHPAGADDLRAVLHRLPPDRIDGLGRIELSFDPFAARDEVVPGVWMPRLRGRYLEGQLVRLYACVVTRELPPYLATYLRLHVLATFMHELAHHEDYMFRTRGDRWRMDDRAKNEAFARARAFELVTAVVIPYLEARDAAGTAALRACVAVPLEVLTDDRMVAREEIDNSRARCKARHDFDVG